jgi:PAS domain S-box-containing protein
MVGAEAMTFQYVPEAIPLGIAAGFSCALACFAWRRRAMPLAPAFTMMMAGETAWALGGALEPIVAEMAVKRLCIDLRILGTVAGILGLVAFVFRYMGLRRWLSARRFAAICAPAFPLILLAWTDPWHHLYFARLVNQRVGGSWIAIRWFGPAFWVMLAYCYGLATVSTALLTQAVVRSSGVHRMQGAVMLFGVLLPWVGDIVKMARLVPLLPVDLVSVTFAVTGLTFLPALLRFHLLGLPPIAWAAVVAGMDDPVVVIDPVGRVVEMNPAAQRLIGRKSHQVAGTEAASVLGQWTGLTDQVGHDASGQESFELNGQSRSMAASFDPRVSPLGDHADPVGWVLVLRDITRLKRAEEERVSVLRRSEEERVRMLSEQAARAEAEAANRAKDRFLATLSHELRTPLTPILATVTAMLDDATTPAAIRGVLEMIRRNVDLEARLIDDLLDLTRIRRGMLHLKREVIDAHSLVHQVVEICREDLRAARLEVRLDLEARQPEVDADPARFQQVLWNLIKNAIKFTPAGGSVTIRSRDADGAANGAAGAGLIIEVSDTGIGIERDVLPRIFEFFEQGELSSARRYGGLGLGLMISRSIVEEHGGRLVAASAGKNLGAKFTVEMPKVGATERAAQREKPRAPREAIPHRPLSILLVEDNTDTLNYLAKLLTLRGDRVRTAASLDSALRVANEVDFELLISDIELPDGSGLELMWKLRSSRPVAGIALSGFGSSDDIELSRTAGFGEHLTKPVDFRRLEEAIQRVTTSTHAGGLVEA